MSYSQPEESIYHDLIGVPVNYKMQGIESKMSERGRIEAYQNGLFDDGALVIQLGPGRSVIVAVDLAPAVIAFISSKNQNA